VTGPNEHDEPTEQPGTGLESVELSGVPETALWTLYFRALGARHGYAGLHDPLASTLVDSLDYPFQDRFGNADAKLAHYQAQRQARRVACVDQEVRRFLARHPEGTVVALGEGLETQFWRVDNGRVRWLSVDLPEAVELRERVLPGSPRQRTVAGSALEPAWMDAVEPDAGVLITAQGLLMYLPPPDVRTLIAGCAQRFPGGELVLDAVPRWFTRPRTRARMSEQGYAAPPMPWAMNADEIQKIRRVHPTISRVEELRWPPPEQRVLRALAPIGRRLPGLGPMRMSVVAVHFAAA
jgi:O-methyltransferase involved in polyketide biosynthesis